MTKVFLNIGKLRFCHKILSVYTFSKNRTTSYRNGSLLDLYISVSYIIQNREKRFNYILDILLFKN